MVFTALDGSAPLLVDVRSTGTMLYASKTAEELSSSRRTNRQRCQINPEKQHSNEVKVKVDSSVGLTTKMRLLKVNVSRGLPLKETLKERAVLFGTSGGLTFSFKKRKSV